MKNEFKKQTIFGLSLAIAIFLGVFGIINGYEFIRTSLIEGGTSTESNEAHQEQKTDNMIKNKATTEKEDINLDLFTENNSLYFPLFVKSNDVSTKITLKNNQNQPIKDIKVHIINKKGEWNTYQPIEVLSQQEYILDSKNLANIPEETNPGIAILVFGQDKLAGVAQITNNTNTTTKPFSPSVELKKDLSFYFTSGKNKKPKQNTLFLTNLGENLTEAQIALVSEENKKIDTTAAIEILPTQTLTLDLNEFNFYQKANEAKSIIVSSSSSTLLGAIAELDNESGTLDNIKVAGER